MAGHWDESRAKQTSYSVPVSESATLLDDEKRGPTCTNCGSLDSKSASFSADRAAAVCREGESGSATPPACAAAATPAAACFCRSLFSIAASTVTSLRAKG